MKLSTYKDIAPKRVLITGLPGSGKSTLAAELTHHGFNLVWFNVENAADTLLKLPPECQDLIDLINIPDSASFPIAAQTLLTVFKTGKGDICNTHGKVSCPVCSKDPEAIINPVDFSKHGSKTVVVIDTATQLSYSLLAYTMKDKLLTDRPERDDWGAIRRYTEYFKSQFQGAQYNLIVVCQAQEAELEDGTVKLVPSFGSAGMSANFASAFSHIVFTEVKNKIHRAFSKSTASNGFLSRSRSDFAIEDFPALSLLPIFTGELPSNNPATRNTPATAAASGLAALKAKMDAAATKQGTPAK